MSEEAIVKYCSPTLAGIKTGSLFSCSYNSKADDGDLQQLFQTMDSMVIILVVAVIPGVSILVGLMAARKNKKIDMAEALTGTE